MTTLINIHHKSKYDIYIGRAGKGQDGYFGNPKEHSADGAPRDVQVERFRVYFYKRIAEDAEFKRRVLQLKDEILACFCYPKLCHGMVYIEYLEGISVNEQMQVCNEIDFFD